MFNTWFSFASDQHNYETSSSTLGNLKKLFFYKTKRYGKYSVTASAVESDFNERNYCNYQLHMLDFCLLHYLLSSDSEAVTLISVITPYIIFRNF